MASDRRHDGGPLERNHIRDMVLRNAMEGAALQKTSKILEKERRAFVRQSTRDEDEMRVLLQRLVVDQTGYLDGGPVPGSYVGESASCHGDQTLDDVDGPLNDLDSNAQGM